MAENWGNGLSDEGRCPEPGYRMAAEGMPFPSRWTSGTISTNLDVIWGMSVNGIVMTASSTAISSQIFPCITGGVRT